MPHNLYLHSSIAQTRHYELSPKGKREAILFGTIDSTIALFFCALHQCGHSHCRRCDLLSERHHAVAEIQDAYKLLSPLLGVGAASTLFAVALLASGQNSTLTGTLAGQIVMEGFLRLRLPPVLRRLITRLIAIIPAVIVTALLGENGTAQLLILSQVILSMQLSFAVIPLVMFTSDKTKMGEFVNPRWIKLGGWAQALLSRCSTPFFSGKPSPAQLQNEACAFGMRRPTAKPWRGSSVNRERRRLSGVHL